MKKIVLGICIAVAGLAANANTVSWGVTFNGARTAGLSASSYVAYFFSGTYDGKTSSLTSALDSATFSYASDTAQPLGTGLKSFDSDLASISFNIVVVDTTNNKYSVVKSGTYTPYGATDTADTTTAALTTAARNVTGTGTAPLTWTALEGASGGGGDTPVDSPEPTSGVLMLLGAGVLALRRKQK